MITRVVISKRAQRQLHTVPQRITDKLTTWVLMVETKGLEETRKIPGYHDEPLKGRRRGQRSIRLSQTYRAIYEIRDDGAVEFVSVEEVSKHEY